MRYGLDASNCGNFDDRTCFPAQSSVLDEEALLRRVAVEYDIPSPQACLFFCRADSDIYRVHTAGPTYYLKVYRPPHPLAWVESEARLVAELAELGVPVVRGVPRKDGAFATGIPASEGLRPALVFEEAPAGQLQPLDENVCAQFGSSVARLHDALDGLSGEYERPVFGRGHLFLSTMPFAQRLIDEDDRECLASIRARTNEQLDQYPRDPSEFGLCHDDLVLSNVRRSDDGVITFFDFGNACFSWRACDLTIVHGTIGRNDRQIADAGADIWQSFLQGYSQVRSLPRDLERRMKLLALFRRVGWIIGAMASCPLRMGTEAFNPEWVKKQMSGIRELADEVLGV